MKIVLVCSLLVVLPFVVRPEGDPPGSGPKKPAEVKPLKIEVTTSQDGPRDIFHQLTVFVDLENPTPNNIQVDRVYMLVGDDLLSTRPKQIWDESKKWKIQPGLLPSPYNWPDDGQWAGPEPSTSFEVTSLGRQSISLVMPAADEESGGGGKRNYLGTLLSQPSLLTFNPQDDNIHVVVDYSDGGEKHYSQRATLKIHFNATWGAIMLGGLVGVGLLFILRVTVAIVDQSVKSFGPAVELKWRSFGPVWNAILLRACWVGWHELIGALVWLPSVIVICVLLMRIKPDDFPITFSVNDFTGGVMLGLFTRTLVEPLIRKLFPSESRASDGTPSIASYASDLQKHGDSPTSPTIAAVAEADKNKKT